MRARIAAVLAALFLTAAVLTGCDAVKTKTHDDCTVQAKQSRSQIITNCGGFTLSKSDYKKVRVGREYDIKSAGKKSGLPNATSVRNS